MKKGFDIKPLILSAVSAVSFGFVGIGTTYALFANDSTTVISSQAGNIIMTKTVSDLQAWSLDENDSSGTRLVERTGTDVNTFAAHGTYNLDTATGALSLSGMVKGDKVSYSIRFVNASNVDIKYRLSFSGALNDTGLYQYLDIKMTKNAVDTDLKTLPTQYFVKQLASATAEERVIDEFKVTVMVPLSVTNEQLQELNGKTCDFYVGYEIIQGNAYTEPVPAP